MAVTDHQAAAAAGVNPPRDHDILPKYVPSMGPPPRLDMDPDRFSVACSENWHRFSESWGKPKVTCGDCGRLLVASTRAELRKLMAEHTRG